MPLMRVRCTFLLQLQTCGYHNTTLEVFVYCTQPTDQKDTRTKRTQSNIEGVARNLPHESRCTWSLLLFSFLESHNKLLRWITTCGTPSRPFPDVLQSVDFPERSVNTSQTHTHTGTHSRTTEACVVQHMCVSRALSCPQDWKMRSVSRSSRQRRPQPILTASWTDLVSGSLSQRRRLRPHCSNHDQRNAARSISVSRCDTRETTSCCLLREVCPHPLVNTPVLPNFKMSDGLVDEETPNARELWWTSRAASCRANACSVVVSKGAECFCTPEIPCSRSASAVAKNFVQLHARRPSATASLTEHPSLTEPSRSRRPH